MNSNSPQSLFRPFSIILATTAAFLIVGTASAQNLLTTRQMRHLPPTEANKVVQRDLLSVLEPISEINSGMFRRLKGVRLVTAPYGTEVPGLCRRDAVWVRYEATNQDNKPEDQPIQPYGVLAVPLFHWVKVPGPETVDAQHLDVWNEACDHLDHNADVIWFDAEDAGQSLHAVKALQLAIIQIKAGSLIPKNCSQFPKATKTCADEIVEKKDLSNLNTVATCDHPTGQMCYRLDFDYSKGITIRGKSSDDGVEIAEVSEATFELYVIVH